MAKKQVLRRSTGLYPYVTACWIKESCGYGMARLTTDVRQADNIDPGKPMRYRVAERAITQRSRAK